MKKITCILLLFSIINSIAAQVRHKQTLNSGWQFVLNDQHESSQLAKANWQKINLPHTWNDKDIIDDTLGFHQGIGWYKKMVTLPAEWSQKKLQLIFEGTANKATIFWNGKKAGEHIGAYTGFVINLENSKFNEPNELLVRVDNSKHLSDSVPPFSGDFNMMGGIYRDVWLVAMNQNHFAQRHGANTIFFETPVVSEQAGAFTVRGSINAAGQNFTVSYSLQKDGKLVHAGKQELKKSSKEFSLNGSIPKPLLWSPEHPHLYQLQVQLKNQQGKLVDEVSMPVGFRWFGINAQQEFTLNGKPYKLKGAARHQDYDGIGNALTDDMHYSDVQLMKDMGCNFIRISHYPHDPAVYEACDKLGLISWSEIPVVDKVVNNATFLKNSERMMEEMILQHFNHPSIAIWGYHNEVRNLEAITVENARSLEQLTKKLDRYRLTAMAFESNIDAPYFTNPLLKDILNITDINGYNVYQGWYRGVHQTIGSFLDTLYAYNPAKPIFLSEYGAGSMVNIHAYNTSLFDFSEEYQVQFNRSYVEAGNTRPWMVGFSIWNFIDFQRDGREDVKPHINKKGMVTTNRQPKDVYYYYKSQWSNEPFVHLAGKHWPKRIAVTGSNHTISIPLVIFSNQREIELYQNNQLIATKENTANGVFEFIVPVKAGTNQFVAKTREQSLTDVININYQYIDTTKFSSSFPIHKLAFNTGQSRTFFTEEKSGLQWIPDKPYTKGTWGYVGGQVYNTWPSAAWNGIREGIHKPIANTINEPLFQTFVEGLESWKADVPPGKYKITILLAEPFTDNQRKQEARIMSIRLNNEAWMPSINLAKDYGVQTAIILEKEITVNGMEGIKIDFISETGKTILNGVSIEKM